MTNQTIGQAVEEIVSTVETVEFLHGVPVNLPSQYKADLQGVARKALQAQRDAGAGVARKALQAQRDAGAGEERERIIKNLSQLRQITVNGELFISAESIKGEISNWSEYKIV